MGSTRSASRADGGRNLPPDDSKETTTSRGRSKPLASRIICAAEAFSGLFVDELAQRCEISAKHLSQLRSGARVDLGETTRVFAALGLDLDTLLQRIESQGEARSAQLIELLSVLLFLDSKEPEPLAVDECTVTCDRLALIFPERVRRQCSSLLGQAFEKGQDVFDGNYDQAARFRRVFVGAGLRWKKGRGLRLDFNPSKLTKRGRKFVSGIVAACLEGELRISGVHVAVDLTTPIGWFQPLGTDGRKHAIIGTSRRLQTIYVGTRESRLSFAIYDKVGSPGTELEFAL